MLYTKRNGLVGSSFNWKGVDVQDWLNNPEKGMINKGSNPLQKEVAMATYREVHGVLYIHQKGLFGALERTYKGWSSIFNPNWWSKYYLRNLPTLLWARMNSRRKGTVSEYISKTYPTDGPREWIDCANGYRISIQGGGRTLESFPKKEAKYFSHLELYFPGASKEELLVDYVRFDNYEDGFLEQDPVLSMVPLKIVEKVIKKYGGIINTPWVEKSNGS